MIEVIKDWKTKELILIDGKRVIACEINEIDNTYNEEEYYLIIWNKLDFDYVLRQSDGLSKISVIECPFYQNWNGIQVLARVDFEDLFFGVFTISSEKWKWIFSPQQYFTEFVRIKGNGLVEVEIDEADSSDKFGTFIDSVRVFIKSNEDFSLFLDEFYKTFSIISEFHNEAVERLSKDNFNIFKFSFNFPEELKIPCEQYLLYFAQFLKDLGINATSDLREEAGKVLFSVTPTDDKEALDKIREALAVYLNLPSSPIIYDDSFAAMRLKAEIERLQSSQRIKEMEFRVTQKALESQDKIILQQSVLLEQQAKVIERITDKSVMINSAENKEELEEIYDGIKIGESKFLKEQLGIHLNPAKVIKTVVKNTFGKSEEKSILGLGEDENEN